MKGHERILGEHLMNNSFRPHISHHRGCAIQISITLTYNVTLVCDVQSALEQTIY